MLAQCAGHRKDGIVVLAVQQAPGKLHVPECDLGMADGMPGRALSCKVRPESRADFPRSQVHLLLGLLACQDGGLGFNQGTGRAVGEDAFSVADQDAAVV